MKKLFTPLFLFLFLLHSSAFAQTTNNQHHNQLLGIYSGTLKKQEQQWYFAPCDASHHFQLNPISPAILEQFDQIAQQYPNIHTEQMDFWIFMEAYNHSDYISEFVLEPYRIISINNGSCSLRDYLKMIAPPQKN